MLSSQTTFSNSACIQGLTESISITNLVIGKHVCVCVYMFTSLSVYITTSPATRLVSMLPVYQGLRDRFMPTRPTTQLDVVCTYKLSVCRCSLSRGGVENKNEKKTLEPFPNCLNYHSIFCGWSTTV